MTDNAITRAGLAKLVAELERLQTSGRAEIAERIREAAASETNQAENSDFDAARAEQALLEQRIARLEQRIADAEIVDPDLGNDVVDVGERVRVRDLDTGARSAYVLVGSSEIDPDQGRISVASPLGRGLLGRKRGEIAVVAVPRGQRRLKILAIEAASEAGSAD